MTIRILNPGDWKLVNAGDWLQLNGDHDRIVKIEINTEVATRVDLFDFDVDGEERKTFLGVVNGIDKIEVVAGAEATIGFTGEGEVWFCTNDGVATAVEIPDEASFTKMVGRKTRSEQLEQIIRMQQASIDRLIVAQEGERIARELAEEQLAAADERPTVVDPRTTELTGGAEQQVPAAGAPAAAAGEVLGAAPAAPAVSS